MVKSISQLIYTIFQDILFVIAIENFKKKGYLYEKMLFLRRKYFGSYIMIRVYHVINNVYL